VIYNAASPIRVASKDAVASINVVTLLVRPEEEKTAENFEL
jgi:hypothetical protein